MRSSPPCARSTGIRTPDRSTPHGFTKARSSAISPSGPAPIAAPASALSEVHSDFRAA